MRSKTLYSGYIFVKNRKIMKKIKDTIINICLFGVLLLALVLVSCDTKKTNKEDLEEITILETRKDSVEALVNKNDDSLVESFNNEFKTRRYKMKDGTIIAYNLDKNGIVGFDDWADFTVVNYELAEVRNKEISETEQRIRNLNFRVANLRNTIPTWLQTEEVLEDISDIQKEYLELIKDSDATEKEMKENLEELTEQFDDLKEELNETITKYMEIQKDAIEEFNEEMDKGNYEKAIEEYNEEIKKLEKITQK